jgi:ubiquinone/menaquinone biosynthesis C-methylase UbiE
MKNFGSLLKCLKCDTRLDVNRARCLCRKCGSEWPVVGGIPRFFQAPTHYWGEIAREDARRLLEAARKGSWAEAVRTRFTEGDDMRIGLLDLQRASWASMLGLSAQSVALDVGSGYGAITHSLSRSAGEVYSVEAVPERIEFTQERLRQEAIPNVRLIQASATALPLVENSFDLVVTNGVLEWIGEWDLEGDPRSAQVRFLDTLFRLLKKDGVLIIGIENRFGYGSLTGENDHSGVPYTSLVPRRVASFMLRQSGAPHHRTRLNAKKEYRTFTYSERGYRKLLADAGFKDFSCYWATPGYNQPYHLIPLTMPKWVREQFLDLLDTRGREPQRSWPRRLARVIAHSPLLPLVLQDFVIIASKLPGRKTTVHSWIEDRFATSGDNYDGSGRRLLPTPWALYTHPFVPKSVVRIGDTITGRDLAYMKVNNGDRNSAADFDAELLNRAQIQQQLQTSASRTICVPHAYGTLRVGNTRYEMESSARGMQLSRIVRRLGYFAHAKTVESDFASVLGGVIELTEALQRIRDARTIISSWRRIPRELDDRPIVRAAVEEARYYAGSPATTTWVQHGDLSIEHISVEHETGRIEIFDWDDMAGGFPPLYDIFHLFYSTGYLRPEEETLRFPTEEERWIASFNAVFFSDTRFTRTVLKLILHACERLKVMPELIPSLLVEFLLVRSHYYQTKSPVQHRVHLRLLELCLEQNRVVLGRFPLRNERDLSQSITGTDRRAVGGCAEQTRQSADAVQHASK